MYLSSKLGKKEALIASTENTFNLQLEEDDHDKTLFLTSLITNVTSDCKVIPYRRESGNKSISINRQSKTWIHKHSPFHTFDNTITSIVKPGRITSIKLYQNENTQKPVVMYSVTGYNFCENIGKKHTRNNVYFIANVFENCIYQKCYKCLEFTGTAVAVFDDADNEELLSASNEVEMGL